jgi:hypothetical protein
LKNNIAKAKLKTEKNEASVTDFINSVKDEQKKKGCFVILEMMQKASGDKPKMWGSAIIGFGNVILKYESGRELDWFKIGFSPRKQNLTLYGVVNPEKQTEILKKLGKHSTGKGCLYINNLKDVDLTVLQNIIKQACKRKK